MVGRYINQEHRQFDRPVARFGNLAMLPEPIHQRERSFEQESFLVDMRSQAGFSGSPVFVYYEEPGWRFLPPLEEPPEPPELPESAEPAERINHANERVEWSAARTKALQERPVGHHVSGVVSKTWLLGIDWGHLPVWDDVFDLHGRAGGRMRVDSGMAAVVPAWKLIELLNEGGIKWRETRPRASCPRRTREHRSSMRANRTSSLGLKT